MVDTEKAKKVAKEEVEKRIVTKDEAKSRFKYWIKNATSHGVHGEGVIDFWKEVSKQVDEL